MAVKHRAQHLDKSEETADLTDKEIEATWEGGDGGRTGPCCDGGKADK